MTLDRNTVYYQMSIMMGHLTSIAANGIRVTWTLI